MKSANQCERLERRCLDSNQIFGSNHPRGSTRSESPTASNILTPFKSLWCFFNTTPFIVWCNNFVSLLHASLRWPACCRHPLIRYEPRARGEGIALAQHQRWSSAGGCGGPAQNATNLRYLASIFLHASLRKVERRRKSNKIQGGCA